MNTNFNLTKRERDILTILWENENGMIASDFPKMKEDLTINTVQVVLKKLLKRGLVQVKEIVYSGTVLSRKFIAVMSEKELLVAEIIQQIYNLQCFGITPAMFWLKCLKDIGLTDEEVNEFKILLKEMK